VPPAVVSLTALHAEHAVLPWTAAAQVLAAGGHRLLLSLPWACLSPAISRHEGAIGATLRHLLEDPATLEGWMESEIKNIMTVKGGMRDPYTGRAYPHNQANPSSRCVAGVVGRQVRPGKVARQQWWLRLRPMLARRLTWVVSSQQQPGVACS
jgi:hypothetical protein